jgi:murein L,D-transpeptidase YcbB/YkuD
VPTRELAFANLHTGERLEVAYCERGEYKPEALSSLDHPENALGRIKLMFPNPYVVYLHDTPSRALFGKAERAASSGCIRVEQPLVLAELLLADPERWSRDALERALVTGKTQTVNLREPVPVILMYWTLDADPDGSVYFKRDLYDRDPRVLRTLDDDFSFRRRAIAGGHGL